MNLVSTSGTRGLLLEMIIASKLKGEAQILVDSHDIVSTKEFGEILRMRFAVRVKSHELKKDLI